MVVRRIDHENEGNGKRPLTPEQRERLTDLVAALPGKDGSLDHPAVKELSDFLFRLRLPYATQASYAVALGATDRALYCIRKLLEGETGPWWAYGEPGPRRPGE